MSSVGKVPFSKWSPMVGQDAGVDEGADGVADGALFGVKWRERSKKSGMPRPGVARFPPSSCSGILPTFGDVLPGEEDSGGKDLYAVLGLARGATDEEIRVAFRNLAVENHPDKYPNDAKAAMRFKRINAAYQVLRDAEKRDQYDQLTAPIEDFSGDAALARPVAPASVPPRGQPEIRYRRRRVRRVRKGWSLFVGTLLSVSAVMLVLSILLDHHGSDASDTSSVPPARSGAAPQAPPPAAPATTVTLPEDEPFRGTPGSPHPVTAPPPGAGADFNGRPVAGPGWQLSVPDGWQEAAGRDDRGAAWQAPADVAGFRPNVKLVIKALTGEPPEYFKELDSKAPARGHGGQRGLGVREQARRAPARGARRD